MQLVDKLLLSHLTVVSLHTGLSPFAFPDPSFLHPSHPTLCPGRVSFDLPHLCFFVLCQWRQHQNTGKQEEREVRVFVLISFSAGYESSFKGLLTPGRQTPSISATFILVTALKGIQEWFPPPLPQGQRKWGRWRPPCY